MNKTVSLLDCTLRDGGYVNDWEFGHQVITETYKRLDLSGVEYIEVGFLDDRRPFDINRTIVPNTDGFNEIFEGVEKKNSIPVAMIDYGTCSIDNIGTCDSTFIDGIRVIFKKEKIDEALPFCKKIKEKGYKLFIQAISITSYSDMEMLEYIQKINEVKPFAFSIVDTYGLLDRRKLTNYFNLLNNNLDKEISIGYHAHNNFQLAFSNTVRFLELQTDRNIIADSTVYGMGKSAGNCPSELIGLHMNQNYGTSYEISQFMEILDTDLMYFYQKYYWGYKYNFFISAMHNCHPNYVQYLLDKKTLTISSVNEILEKLPEDNRLLYDEKIIENAYYEYQDYTVDDTEAINELADKFSGRSIVLIGPGKSIKEKKDDIIEFAKRNDSIIIPIHYIPDFIDWDFVFVSNSKRYGKLMNSVENKVYNGKLITTSNISFYDYTPDYILNYCTLIKTNNLKTDNSLLLFLSALMRMNVKNVTLAGFDGFLKNETNYFEETYCFSGNENYQEEQNAIINEELKILSKKIKIEFLTESKYQKGLEING